jgi:hypothetical protein
MKTDKVRTIIFLPIILTRKILSNSPNIKKLATKRRKNSHLLTFNLTIAFNRNRH